MQNWMRRKTRRGGVVSNTTGTRKPGQNNERGVQERLHKLPEHKFTPERCGPQHTPRSSHRGRVRHLARALLSGRRHGAPFVAYFQRTRLELRQCMPPPIVDCPPCSPRLAYRRRVQQAVLSARSLARPCLTCSSPAQCTTSDVRRLAPRLTPRSWSPLAPRAQVRLASTRADLSPSTLIDYVI